MSIDLDLRTFYDIVASNRKFKPIIDSLYGLRPLRPASLFEMLVTAITEQQISLRLAYLIRDKMAALFGDELEDTLVFPHEITLAKATMRDLLRCGLSHRKSEYIRDLAKMVTSHRLDLESLKQTPDDDACDKLTQIRGIGPWSAEYVLVRGLGRPDRVPVEDIGIRDVVGKYLGKGHRVEPNEVLRFLRPFAPFKGLAAFYLLAYDRLSRC